MSISRSHRGRAAITRIAREAGGFRLPATVSRPVLLIKGSDERFRQLVYDLLTIATRMTLMREHLGRRMGITGPQYSVLMAIAQLQGRAGVGVGTIARRLHVSSAFIATETGKLVQAGLLDKRPNPKDRRRVLLNLTRAAHALIERNRLEIRAVNDAFFGALSRSAFTAISSATAALVLSSRRAMARLNDIAEPLAILREAAE
jgi:DNA-binding MarR family transcriptional regulator